MFLILFDFLFNMIENYIIVRFVRRFLGYKVLDKKSKLVTFFVWLLLLIEITVVNYLTIYEGLEILFPILILFLYACWVLRGKIIEKLFAAIAPIVCISLTTPLTILCMCVVLEIPAEELLSSNGLDYYFLVVITKILLLAITFLVLKVKDEKFITLKDKQWFVFLLVPFISIIAIVQILSAVLQMTASKNILINLLISIAGIIATNIITFFLLLHTSKNNQLQMKYKLLDQKYYFQKENINQLILANEEIRRTKHDMKNMLFAIKVLSEQNKNHEILEYCERLMKPISISESLISTGNDLVDEILNYKFSEARQKEIHIEYQISMTFDKIDAMDICIILGNLLDNAIEASVKEPVGARNIHLCVYKQGNYLMIEIKNKISKSVLSDNKTLLTTKAEKESHGMGIQSVKHVVDKYKGIVDNYEIAGWFYSVIYL